MDSLHIQCILSVVFTLTGLTHGAGVLQDSLLHAAVGGKVIFRTTMPQSEIPFRVVAWNFLDKNGRKINILTVTNENITHPEYEGRISLMNPPGSLELRNLTLNDSGEYNMNIIPGEQPQQQTGDCRLVIYVPISNVVVTPTSTDLVEFISSVKLSCSSSGSSPSFLWLNGSSEVTASERVQITNGGSILTIIIVTRYDQGPFRCNVFNPINADVSDPVDLSISYGPENINLTISPSQKYHNKGSDINMACSAVSRPSALFYWFVNETSYYSTGPELRLNNIQKNHSGNYSCMAYNNKTQRNQTSSPALVLVLDRVSGAFITSSNQPFEGNSVNLTCDADGSVFSRKWMKNGSPLIAAENVTLHDEDRVLFFHILKKTDTGQYSCLISNPLSSDEVEYHMIVNYGPENVKITGPNVIEVNQFLQLTCSAESTPSANYTWTVNGTDIHHSAVLTKNVTEYSDSGDYFCQARNSLTGRNATSVVHRLHVKAPEKADFPVGGIIGITLCCLIVVGGAAGGVYFVHRNRKLRKKPSNGNTSKTTGGEGQDNTAYTENEELNYAHISNFPMRGSGTIQQRLQESEYAQVRVNSNARAAAPPPSYDVHMQRIKRTIFQPDANASQLHI